MHTRKLLLFLLIFFSLHLSAQVCTNLGQNPGTAFPVCGSSTFTQSTVAICGSRTVPSKCKDQQALFQDKNPYWYKFTCFATGTLGFIITPNNLNDDYDWQLFDVTGHNPDEIYTNTALFAACDWSGEPGKTGASAAGTSLVLCAGTGVPLFSAMPTLIKDHNYLLLISHFTNSQSGYTLEFKGGTASITDTTPPKLQHVAALCDGRHVTVKLNKRMKCSTLATDGSDFTVSGTSSPASVVSASGTNCSAAFDMDSIVLTLNTVLQPGSYTLKITKGIDNNTLLDICDAAIPIGDSLSFTVFPPTPTAFDSISPVKCAPTELQLVFKDAILCNSVAADGSDFMLSGSAASIASASANCSNGVSNIITLKLSAPISTKGTWQVTLKKGTDGNTILNQCQQETPAGAAVSFATRDTVSAKFNYTIHFNCKADSVEFFNSGKNEVNQWNWNFNNSGTSSLQNPVHVFSDYGVQHITLLVSNGFCSDSASADVNLDNQLKASFTSFDQICPQDAAVFKDTSIGKITSWQWSFGNGQTSTLKNPPSQYYPAANADKTYPVTLVVKNDHNCYDTSTKQLKVLYTCFIGVPTAFTPNSDGLNDYLYPINAWLARNFKFKVYNRYGQLVFETSDYTKKWDGTFKGIKQESGTYVWMLQYSLITNNQQYSLKGTTVLMR